MRRNRRLRQRKTTNWLGNTSLSTQETTDIHGTHTHAEGYNYDHTYAQKPGQHGESISQKSTVFSRTYPARGPSCK